MLQARGWDMEGLEMSCPALADIATTSIAEAIKAEAAANFGQALTLLQQARTQLLEAAETDSGSTPLRREAIQEAIQELGERIEALTSAVETGLRAAGLRCPLFARADNNAETPVTGEQKPSERRRLQEQTPVSSVCFTPISNKRNSQTPQERRLRMEEVNASRKRLEAAAGGALSQGNELELAGPLVEDLLAAGESFGCTLRNKGGLEAAVAHLERSVEIMRCMPKKTEGVAARAAAFDTAIEILLASAGAPAAATE